MTEPVSVSALHNITAFVTPFDSHGDLLPEQIAPLVRRQQAAGIDALWIAGPIGEGDMLLSNERQEYVVTAVNACAGAGIGAIVDVSAPSTRKSVVLAEHAESSGATAIVYALPSVDGCDPAMLLRNVSAIAEAANLPIIVRSSPDHRVKITVETMTALAAVGSLHGCIVEDLSCGLRLMYELPLLVWSNADYLIGPSIIAGLHGVVTTIGNLVPEPVSRLVRASRTADLDEMRDLQRWSTGICDLLGCDFSIPRLKAAMRLNGIDAGWCRLPRRDLSPAEIEPLAAALRQWVPTA